MNGPRDLCGVFKWNNICIIKFPGEKKEKGQENIWRNNGWEFSKFDERYEYKHPRSSPNSKEDKEIYLETHNQTFESQDKKIILKEQERRFLTSLITREMQIQTTMRNHLACIMMATIKNKTKSQSKNYKCWQECGEIGSHVNHWWEFKMVQLLWKTVQLFLQNLKIELPYYPTVSLLNIYQKDIESKILKRYFYTHIHSRIIFNS